MLSPIIPTQIINTMGLRNFRFRGETQELDDRSRAGAPGRFIELSLGQTHYESSGNAAARSVVLVPGFSIPYYIWNPTFEALVRAGFHVVRYDLYGRGYSDRPDTAYDHDLFAQQLYELIDALNLRRLIDLIGLSMGGPISLAFWMRHPSWVRKICFIDPAGFPMKITIVGKLLSIPLLGEWILSLFGDKILLSELTKDFANPERFPAFVEKAKIQMTFSGYKRAILSTLRNGVLSNQSEAYANLGRNEVPTLLIWGRQDKLIPFKNSKRLMQAIPHTQFFPIDHAGHIPHYEDPQTVNPIIVDFLID